MIRFRTLASVMKFKFDVFWYTAYIKNIGSLQPSRKGSISLSSLFYLILLCIFLVFQYVGIRRTLGVDFWNWTFDSGPLGVEIWHPRVNFRALRVDFGLW